MTTKEIATIDNAALLEKVVIDGDLSKLSPAERMSYYNRVCDSLGLNPLTKPFQYLRLSGKLVLYAAKDCTEQLSRIHKISISLREGKVINDVFVVQATAKGTYDVSAADWRSVDATGIVAINGLKGEALANAMMKAETKASRRAVLRFWGLGWLDETEVETIPGSVVENVDPETGEIALPPAPKASSKPQANYSKDSKDFMDTCKVNGWSAPQVTGWLGITPEEWKEKRIDGWLKRNAGATSQDAIDLCNQQTIAETESTSEESGVEEEPADLFPNEAEESKPNAPTS